MRASVKLADADGNMETAKLRLAMMPDPDETVVLVLSPTQDRVRILIGDAQVVDVQNITSFQQKIA